MGERYLIEPDTKFIKEVIGQGGESLKKCFQCSSCTVVCPLSPDERPFPRKEMIWAQWGLKDKLAQDPDIWLCHRCNDCSTYCPRGSKPGDVLAAIRSYVIMEHAAPHFVAKAFSSAKYLPLLLLFPALFLLAFLGALGDLTFPSGEIVLGHFVPVHHLSKQGVQGDLLGGCGCGGSQGQGKQGDQKRRHERFLLDLLFPVFQAPHWESGE